MPQFDIIMPLYNKAPYVRKAVESIVGQTYTDWDLWIVDDGGTDGGGEIVKALGDSRIHYHRQENAGVGAARNKGIALSGETDIKSPYVTFLDADDWWEPTFLEEMAELIVRHPDAGIYGTGYYIVKNKRKKVAPVGVDEGFTEGEINYCRVYAKTLCMPLWTGAVCMPRNVFEEQGGFPTGIKLGEDFLLWIHTALKHKVVFLNKPLSNYNQDVDATYRGTHNLHRPEDNMMWHLGDLEPLEATDPDYKQLVDRLRTYNLLPYHLNRQYHSAAAIELAKVDWSKLPAKSRNQYQMPVWMLRLWQSALKTGVKIKNLLQ